MIKSNNKTKKIDGQYNSHLEYCSLPSFWQHFDGQQLGQQQQQQRHIH